MTRLVPAILAAAALLGVTAAAGAAEPPDPSVRLFDRPERSERRLPAEEFTQRKGWVLVPEGTASPDLVGDAVLMNDKVAVVVPKRGEHFYVYRSTADGFRLRSMVQPVPYVLVPQFLVAQNDLAAVEVEATFRTMRGTLTCRLRMTAGEPILELRPGQGMEQVISWGLSDVRGYVVVPDFFGDDVVFPAPLAALRPVGLPAENVLIHVGGGFTSMVMCVWEYGAQNADLFTIHPSAGPDAGICRIPCAKDKRIWIACLETPDLWYASRRLVQSPGPTGFLRRFKPPFAAKWRADFVGPGGACDSVTFEQPPETPPVPDTWRGPVLIYPIDRSRATPLTTILPVDVLRATLGVGPCQYILALEGLSSGDVPPTAAAVTEWVEKQFKRKRDARVAGEIRERLDAMLAHLAAARARIAEYAAFGRQVRAVCREAAKEAPAAEDVRALLAICDRLDRDLARGREAMAGPEVAAGLASEIAALVGKTGALAECEKRGERLRAIGQAHDATLARCRMAVRRMAAHCRSNESDLAKQVHAMAETMLRSRR